MALHNLKITVVDGGRETSSSGSSGLTDGGTGSSKKSGGSTKKEDSLLNSFLHYNTTIKNKLAQATSVTTAFAIMQGAQLAAQVGKEFINFYVSDIGRANGDSNYQSIVNRKIEKVTDGMSLISGAWSGAVAGSVGGVVGVTIGAVIGLASSGVSLGFKYAERSREYQHEIFEENNSQSYQLARANYSVLTGRVR